MPDVPEADDLPSRLADVVGHGTAHDDRIRVTIAEGRVRDLELQPLAMRQSNVDLADAIVAAVNEALGDYAERMTAALGAATPDPGLLAESTRGLRGDELTAVRSYTDALFDALAQVQRRRG